jgi:hypothetical protein
MAQLLDYSKLILKVEKEFAVFEKPQRVTIPGEMSEEMSLIEADFKKLSREEMTHYDCAMMTIDGALISDEAILYFMPKLVEFTLKDEGHHFLLSQRLKSLDNLKLNETQNLLLKEVITALKDYEDALENAN